MLCHHYMSSRFVPLTMLTAAGVESLNSADTETRLRIHASEPRISIAAMSVAGPQKTAGRAVLLRIESPLVFRLIRASIVPLRRSAGSFGSAHWSGNGGDRLFRHSLSSRLMEVSDSFGVAWRPVSTAGTLRRQRGKMLCD